MVSNYQYPIDTEWSTKEIVDVINFFACVEKAYECGVKQEEVMTKYSLFKKVVQSKMEEKKIGKSFEDTSGYSIYRVITSAKSMTSNKIVKIER